ncbi:MAG TPA: glycosyltransferase family 2 protein [Candidatus Saccharimonadales bacterium]|nr:glycosyltransferase family 2 protein [Candidatus Saccharimonadales bacterium]
MDHRLPISVLIPTRNCAPFLKSHFASLDHWISRVQEIIVVDSESKDGTVEFMQAHLQGPRVKFLTHPPGLYQSWNFGIQNASAKYIYISTVGDFITARGLEHLYEIAEKFQSDVVISKPNFMDAGGQPTASDHWPIDEILQRLGVLEPILLSTAEQFLFAVTNTYGALLGSSASNLYRTGCLQQRPFPVEFGTAGDQAWGILNIFEVTIAVTPERISSFRKHEKSYPSSEYHVDSLPLKLSCLHQGVIAQQRTHNPRLQPVLDSVQWDELQKMLKTSAVGQEKLERTRDGKVPWFVRPEAWSARRSRNRAQKRVADIIGTVLKNRPC